MHTLKFKVPTIIYKMKFKDKAHNFEKVSFFSVIPVFAHRFVEFVASLHLIQQIQTANVIFSNSDIFYFLNF